MPCDTRYETTPMTLGAVDRKILARSLQADGYNVRTLNGTLTASKYGTTIEVGANGATLTAADYADRERLTAKVLQSYGKLAATETAKRFGFTPLAEKRLDNGGIKLTFKRSMGGTLQAKPLGKVGL
jgi:hypothetical protein